MNSNDDLLKKQMTGLQRLAESRVPPQLEGEHRVKLVRGEYRGQRQYTADRRIAGYWLVMDTSKRRHLNLEDGETWIVTVMRVANKTAFCWLQRKLLNSDGLHPFMSAVRSYCHVERKVGVTIYRGNETFVDREPIESITMQPDGHIRLVFRNGKVFITSEEPTVKDGAYGRMTFTDYVGGKSVHGVFWES